MKLAQLKWLGTVTGVTGALLLAIKIPLSGWGFVLFLVSSVSWGVAGIRMKEPSLWVLHGVFTLVNLVGVYRWLF